MDETRPMPKRTRDDFVTIHRLCATIETLAPDATPWQVATVCATAIADLLEAHAVVIHQHDAFRRELRSIGVHGPNAGDLLGTTTNVDDDYVVTAVLTNRKPLTMRLDGALPRFVPERHRLLGTTRSLAAFPVIGKDGCVGIIEVAGVADERRERVKDACHLVAQRLILAFEAVGNKGRAISDAPTAPHVHAVQTSSDSDPRLLPLEPRPASATPATFPKRAPTLLCRIARTESLGLFD